MITNQARRRPAELVGIVSVTEDWTVARHRALAEEIIAKEADFVLDAGTGMYLNAILLDIPLAPKVPDRVAPSGRGGGPRRTQPSQGRPGQGAGAGRGPGPGFYLGRRPSLRHRHRLPASREARPRRRHKREVEEDRPRRPEGGEKAERDGRGRNAYKPAGNGLSRGARALRAPRGDDLTAAGAGAHCNQDETASPAPDAMVRQAGPYARRSRQSNRRAEHGAPSSFA